MFGRALKNRTVSRRQNGFTLVELLSVMLVIGILIGIAVPVYKSSTQRAQQNTCYANQQIIERAVPVFAAAQGRPPRDIGELVSGGFLQETPLCPVGKDVYGLDGHGKVTTSCHHGYYR